MKTYTPIKSVQKTFELIRFLSNQADPVSAEEISNALAMRYGTVQSHLHTLVGERVVVKSQEGGYRLGMGMALFWAKSRAILEAEKQEVEKQIAELEGGAYAG